MKMRSSIRSSRRHRVLSPMSQSGWLLKEKPTHTSRISIAPRPKLHVNSENRNPRKTERHTKLKVSRSERKQTMSVLGSRNKTRETSRDSFETSPDEAFSSPSNINPVKAQLRSFTGKVIPTRDREPRSAPSLRSSTLRCRNKLRQDFDHNDEIVIGRPKRFATAGRPSVDRAKYSPLKQRKSLLIKSHGKPPIARLESITGVDGVLDSESRFLGKTNRFLESSVVRRRNIRNIVAATEVLAETLDKKLDTGRKPIVLLDKALDIEIASSDEDSDSGSPPKRRKLLHTKKRASRLALPSSSKKLPLLPEKSVSPTPTRKVRVVKRTITHSTAKSPEKSVSPTPTRKARVVKRTKTHSTAKSPEKSVSPTPTRKARVVKRTKTHSTAKSPEKSVSPTPTRKAGVVKRTKTHSTAKSPEKSVSPTPTRKARVVKTTNTHSTVKSQKTRIQQNESLTISKDNASAPQRKLKKSIVPDLATLAKSLHASSIPKILPCREEEFDTIYELVVANVRAKRSRSLYISGVPGTGKTATVHKVITRLEESGAARDFDYVEVNGMRLAEPSQLFPEIYRQLRAGNAAAPKRVGAATAARWLNRVFTRADAGRKPVVILVDEVQSVLKEIAKSPRAEAVAGCSTQEKLVLNAAVSEYKRTGQDEMTQAALVRQYHSICHSESITPLTGEDLNALCGRLCSSRILLASTSLGAWTRLLRLNVPPDDVVFALSNSS